MGDIDDRIGEAVAMAGDEYAVLICRNVGNAAGNITMTDSDGEESGTQWQNYQQADAIRWAMRGMVGVIVVSSWWDNDAQSYPTEITTYENTEEEE